MLRQRFTHSTGTQSSVSADSTYEDDSDIQAMQLGWLAYAYMLFIIAALAVIIVVTSITLAKANDFKDHATHAFKTVDKFYHEFNHLAEKLSHLKIPDDIYPKLPPHYNDDDDDDDDKHGHHDDDGKKCYLTDTYPYRPYESQYLEQPYNRYVNGHYDIVQRQPNARAISQTIMSYKAEAHAGKKCEIMPNKKGVSAWAWQWGQFIDHEFSLTPTSEEFGVMTVDIKCDAIADPDCNGKSIKIKRSNYKSDDHDHRQQINHLTPYLDASAVYGSTAERYSALRSYEYGQLKTSNGNLMPFNEDGLPNEGGSERSDLFLGGDVRANEQLGLTCVHTLWVREHNYWAAWLYKKFEDWSDDKLYWTARRIVTAEIQAITYQEWLPAILGEAGRSGSKKEYGMPAASYDPKKKPGMMNSFVTAAYRFGHSMVGDSLLLYDAEKKAHHCMSLKDTFFKPSNVKKLGLEVVLAGLAHQPSEEVDLLVVDSLRNFLHFADFIDLATLNIMRGRDHGLPYYHELYNKMTGKHISSWEDVTSHKRLQNRLKTLYDDHWDAIDAFVGILAEDAVDDSMLGITGTAMLVDHFSRIRDSDAYYYEWDEGLPEHVRQEIHKVTLKDVIVRNTDLETDHLPKNVFYVE